MEKTMFENYTHEERIEMLQANADGVENRVYYEELPDEDLAERRSRFIQLSFGIARLEDEKKEMIAEFKVKMEPLKIEVKELLSELKTGHAEKEGRIFKMVNRDEGMVGYYTEAGNLVESRPGTKEEISQLSIIVKAATNEKP